MPKEFFNPLKLPFLGVHLNIIFFNMSNTNIKIVLGNKPFPNSKYLLYLRITKTEEKKRNFSRHPNTILKLYE